MKYVDFGKVMFNPKDVSYIVLDIRTIQIFFKRNSSKIERTFDTTSQANEMYERIKSRLC